MDFISWMHETNRTAEPMLNAALEAAGRADPNACAQAARETAILYLRRYLEAVENADAEAEDNVAVLLETAARNDPYFERLKTEAKLLDAIYNGEISVEDIVDALKEIRFMALGRAGTAFGFSADLLAAGECDPCLEALVTHATTVERAASIFTQGALYSFNQCVEWGLLTGEPVGAKYLLDPRRCSDFVTFGVVSNYHASEKVANSQRKGILDEVLEEDYQPSVRLFFDREQIESLPGFDNDGLHQFMIRDQVSLDHLVCVVFPNEIARDASLARVAEPKKRAWLAARCLVAPSECCDKPQDYVRVTNEIVAGYIKR